MDGEAAQKVASPCDSFVIHARLSSLLDALRGEETAEYARFLARRAPASRLPQRSARNPGGILWPGPLALRSAHSSSCSSWQTSRLVCRVLQRRSQPPAHGAEAAVQPFIPATRALRRGFISW